MTEYSGTARDGKVYTFQSQGALDKFHASQLRLKGPEVTMSKKNGKTKSKAAVQPKGVAPKTPYVRKPRRAVKPVALKAAELEGVKVVALTGNNTVLVDGDTRYYKVRPATVVRWTKKAGAELVVACKSLNMR